MIRCNQCMETFETEDDLSLIVEKSELCEGDWYTTDRFRYDPERELRDTETETYEIFKGCPLCLADEHLIGLLYEE